VPVVVLVNVAATLLMAGMVWTVQVVHYPLFSLVGPGAFPAYERAHTRRIAGLLAVPWALEGLSSVWIAAAPPAGVPAGLAVAGLVAAGVPVLVTVAHSVRQHARLADGFAPEVLRRLLVGNAVRTAAWTLHAAVALAIAVAATG
jgi:hypothetical protein